MTSQWKPPARTTRIRPNGALAGITAALALALCGCGGSGAGSSGSGSSSAGTAGGPVSQGSRLYQTDGCAGCHSLNGTRLVGPSWKGLAGSRVRLTDGRTVTADDAYLTRHILEPNAMTVQGYPGEVMGQAIEVLDLRAHPAEVRDLVAFIDSLR
jgi:cytochrome c oxidase subunit 2